MISAQSISCNAGESLGLETEEWQTIAAAITRAQAN
jgi:hypothetical protein